jgi:hypothetical protein
MNFGRFLHWNPFPNKKIQKLYISDYMSTLDSLNIFFKSGDEHNSTSMKIIFPNSDIRFRITDETYQMPVIGHFLRDPQNLEKYHEFPLFIVEGSDLMKLFEEETAHLYTLMKNKLIHYNIWDSNWIVDVISIVSPQIEIFEGGQLVDKIESQWHSDIYNLDGTPKQPSP